MMWGVDFFEQYVELISDKGWHKRLTKLDQDIYIGTLRDNGDGVIEVDGKVEPRHLLIRPAPTDPFRCVLYNLSTEPVAYYPTGVEQSIHQIQPNQFQELYDQDRVHFGSYKFIYHGDRQPGPIRLKLRWRNGNHLHTRQYLEGEVFIHVIDRNLQLGAINGGASQLVQAHESMQFTLTLDSPKLPKRCFRSLDHGAVIYPNSRNGIVKRFQLHHPLGFFRQCGDQPFTFRVSATGPNPQSALIKRVVKVEPYFKHQIKVAAHADPSMRYLSVRPIPSGSPSLWRRLFQSMKISKQSEP